MIRKRTTMTTHARRRQMLVCLFGVILLGTATRIAGTLGGWAPSISGTSWVGDFFGVASGFSGLFWEGISGGMPTLLGLFLLGFSAVGQPLAVLVLGAYGFCLAGVLAGDQGGGALRLICLLPYYVPVCGILAMGARESMRYGGRLSAYVFQDDPAEQMPHQLKLYCVRFGVLAVLLVLLSAGYGMLFYAFRAAGGMEQMGI